ncbi:MAG: DUF3592 domain-containing protein [Lachnospiraceae bacterium]|nr:DUF3592 domain-containing protein [Lachnospiraceae bacterium]
MNKTFAFFRATAAARFLIPAGIILAVAGFIFFPIVNQTKDWTGTEATVIRTELAQAEYEEDGELHEATYDTYIRYTAGGAVYEELLGEMSGCQEGDTIRVVYDPAHPESVSQPVGMIFPFALIGAGIAAVIAGIVSLIFGINKHRALRAQERAWGYAV